MTFRVKWNQENTHENKGMKVSYYISNGNHSSMKTRNWGGCMLLWIGGKCCTNRQHPWDLIPTTCVPSRKLLKHCGYVAQMWKLGLGGCKYFFFCSENQLLWFVKHDNYIKFMLAYHHLLTFFFCLWGFESFINLKWGNFEATYLSTDFSYF